MSFDDNAIRIRDLSKEYYFFPSTLDRLLWIFAGIKRSSDSFCALKGVNMDIRKGESIGIIGRNGSGKSTLLKMLAGTTTPSTGRLRVNGRVAALLELGLGFHHELTGHENVVMNAFFSGINEKELPEKQEFIRNFSELGEFFYRPVRMYSTGMFMRLAFSMAIAVEPKILIVDEALSVGDQRFQKKCIDYITGLLGRGVTLVFCSHDMYTVEMLCSRTVWLEHGHVKMAGSTRKVVAAYLESLRKKKQEEVQTFENPPIVLENIEILNKGQKVAEDTLVDPFSDVTIRLYYKSLEKTPLEVHFGIGLYASDETESFATSTAADGLKPVEVQPGQQGSVNIRFPRIQLLDGIYTVTGIIQDVTSLHVYHRLIKPEAMQILLPEFRARGVVFLDHQWHLDQ